MHFDDPNHAAFFALAILRLPGMNNATAAMIISQAPVGSASAGDVHAAIRECSSQSSEGITESQALQAIDEAEAVLRAASDRGISVLALSHPQFPSTLKAIPNPPPVIFVQGNLDALYRHDAIAIVGTRTPTSFGEEAAYRLARHCAEAGVAVVSGLAPGCDTLAHEGCLDGGGSTVAVLAHGVDVAYPPAKVGLATRIVRSGGTLLSEYAPGTRWRPKHFVARDRLQSALSRVVLVIETDLEGGTMHTVRFAQKQGKRVACLVHPPENRDEPMTQGNQRLISSAETTPISNEAELTHLLRAMG